MSGGVDSSVAAFLMKRQGYEVSGVFMQLWDSDEVYSTGLKSACFGPEKQDIQDASKVAEVLGINLHLIDLKKEYREIVISYFREEYSAGRTPNPCVVCNRFVKFGRLPEMAADSGIEFDFFVTGHYARVDFDDRLGRYVIKKGEDPQKEQSYFLFMLTQKQLSNLKMPLGAYTKQQVRAIAKEAGLPVSGKAESQDFISGPRDAFFPESAVEGDVVDLDGQVIGRHKGIFNYTVGQRRGVGVAAGRPQYVVEIDSVRNRIILGSREDLYRSGFIASGVNFPGAGGIEAPLAAEVKIRYKHPGAAAVISPLNGVKDRLDIRFSEPQWAITKGQAAVFYSGERLLGGGFIESVY